MDFSSWWGFQVVHGGAMRAACMYIRVTSSFMLMYETLNSYLSVFSRHKVKGLIWAFFLKANSQLLAASATAY